MEQLTDCEPNCNKQRVYTDGIFWLCFCKAKLMNTFAGAIFSKPSQEPRHD